MPSGTTEPDVLLPGSTVLIEGEALDVRKDDWIMLINEDPTLEAGFQKQIGFFRVIGLGGYDSGNDRTPITLDGRVSV